MPDTHTHTYTRLSHICQARFRNWQIRCCYNIQAPGNQLPACLQPWFERQSWKQKRLLVFRWKRRWWWKRRRRCCPAGQGPRSKSDLDLVQLVSRHRFSSCGVDVGTLCYLLSQVWGTPGKQTTASFDGWRVWQVAEFRHAAGGLRSASVEVSGASGAL